MEHLEGNDLIVFKMVDIAAEGAQKFEIRKKTSLSTEELDRILKRLLQKRLIIKTKTPESRGKNVWITPDKKVVQEAVQAKQDLQSLSTVLDRIRVELGRGVDSAATLATTIGRNEGMGEQKVKLALTHLRNLGQVALISNYVYRVERSPKLAGVPCWKCPFAGDCRPGGLISPENCQFYEMF